MLFSNLELLTIHDISKLLLLLTALDIVFWYNDLLSLVLIIWVYGSLPRMVLQLELIELLFGVTEADRGLT